VWAEAMKTVEHWVKPTMMPREKFFFSNHRLGNTAKSCSEIMNAAIQKAHTYPPL
jgi:hypothetical protein